MELISSDEVKCPYLLFMIVIGLLVVSVFLLLYSLYGIMLIYQLAAMIVLSFLVIYSYFCGYWYRINKVYTKNIPTEFNYTEGEEYVGVVIANKGFRFNKYTAIYNGAILLLIEFLRNENKPLKIVKEASREEVSRLIRDQNCKELFLIGHGRRYGIKLSQKEILTYADFKGAHKKDRVEQLHCCHKGGSSLAEILGAEEKFKSYKKRNCEELIGYFLKELVKK